jgi:chaperonin GroES
MPPPDRASSSPRARRKRKPAEEIRLTADRLVVRTPPDGERRSRGGLLIPATAGQPQKRCVWGDVRLVGPDVRHVKPGDRILFLPQIGLEVEIDGQDFLLLRERDVQAIASAQSDGRDQPGGQYL